MGWVGPIIAQGQGDTAGLPTIAMTGFGSTIPAGSLIVISECQNIASAACTAADNSTQAGAANSYTSRTAVNGTTHHGRHLWCVTTRDILSTDTITLSQGTGFGTRTSIMLTTWIVPLSSSPIDASATMAGTGTSPCAMGPTGALLDATELTLASHWWKGGAVASGVADATTGYTLIAPVSSGGVTTREEACVSWKIPSGTAAESDTKTFTSITNAVGEMLTFRTTAELFPARDTHIAIPFTQGAGGGAFGGAGPH